VSVYKVRAAVACQRREPECCINMCVCESVYICVCECVCECVFEWM